MFVVQKPWLVLLGKQSSGRHSSSTEAASGIRLITSTESRAAGVGAAGPTVRRRTRAWCQGALPGLQALLPVSGVSPSLGRLRPWRCCQALLALCPALWCRLWCTAHPLGGQAGVVQGVCAGWVVCPCGSSLCLQPWKKSWGLSWKSCGIRCQQNSTLGQGGTCCNTGWVVG